MSTLEKMSINVKLEHKLSREEREVMIMELVRDMAAIDNVTDDLKEYAANAKSKIQALQNSVKRLTVCVKDGVDSRTVPVEVARDFVRNIKIFTRLDTNEIYKEEPLGAEEQQPKLPGTSENDGGDENKDNNPEGNNEENKA